MSYTDARFTVSASAGSLPEGDGGAFVDLTLALRQGLGAPLSVRWAMIPPGGAPFGFYGSLDAAAVSAIQADLSAAQGTVTFAAGETSRTVRIGIVGDAVAENNESFTFMLPDIYGQAMSSGYYWNGYPNYTPAPPSAYSASFTVLNDDAPAMRLAGGAVVEGAAGSNAALPFTVTLDAPMSAPVTVGWRTLDGTALAGSDYEAASGTLVFAPGETSKVIPVRVLGDALVENNETVRLELSGPSNAVLAGGGATSSATGTVRADDAPPWPGTARLSTGANGAQADAGAGGFFLSDGGARLLFNSIAGNIVAGDGNGANDVFSRDLAGDGPAVRVVTSGEALGEGWSALLPVLPGGAPSFAASADGGRIAFLAARNGARDVFVEDLATGTARRVGADGAEGVPALSADGRLLAFASAAALVPGDDATSPDIFLRDLDSGTTARLSRDANGAPVGGGGYRDLALSADGGKLAFTAAGVNGGPAQVWVRDLASGAVTLASATAGGIAGNGDSGLAAFSPDGARLAFNSAATDLSPIAAVTPGLAAQTWIKDLGTGALTLASADGAGTPARAAGAPAGIAALGHPAFSADGTLLAFGSEGRLLAADADDRADIYVRAVAGGPARLVEGGDGAAAGPAFLPDGSVAFLGAGSDLVAGDTNGAADVFRAAVPAAAPAGPSFSAGDMEVVEAGGGTGTYASFNISLNGVARDPGGGAARNPDGTFSTPQSSVRWSIAALPGAQVSADGRYAPAEAGSDFVAASGTVFFASNHPSTSRTIGGDPYAFMSSSGVITTNPASGDGHLNAYFTHATIRVAIPNDTVAEADEVFVLTLSDATGAAIGDAQGVGVIRNDDAPLLRIADAAAEEGGALVFDVRLEHPTARSATVGWRTADGTAVAGADYAAASGTLTFAPGEMRKAITVPLAKDAAAEGTEAMRVELFSPGSATFADGASGTLSATGSIRAHDEVPSRAEYAVTGAAGVDAATLAGGLRGAAVLTLNGMPSRVVLADGATAYTLSGVEVLDFVDGRLVFDAADPAAQAARLYRAALGRAPDQAGLNYYDGLLEGGGSLAGIASGFLNSAEFRERAGGAAGDDAYVLRLYANVLGRTAAEGELGYWRGVLGAGASREEVLVGFSESAENKARTAELLAGGLWDRDENAATVARLYDSMLGRLPDLEGMRFHLGHLGRGTLTVAELVRGFGDSAEFRGLYGDDAGSAELVELLYRNTLRREGSAAEVSYYVDLLDGGVLSRSQVVLFFSESAEHAALTAPSVGGESPAQFGILFA